MEDNNHIVIHGFMRNKLNLSGNELMVYAIIYGFSQDGESKFFGSRQYLADWCGCTTRSVQTILNDLTDRGLLKKYEEWNKGVKSCQYIAVADFTTSENISPGASEKISPPSEKTSLYNIANNIDLDKIESISSKEDISVSNITVHKCTVKPDTDISAEHYTTYSDAKTPSFSQTPSLPQDDGFEGHSYADEFLGSARRRTKPTRQKKPSLYQQCYDEILAFTKNIELQDQLTQYLQLRLNMKDKSLYGVNQWKGMLNKLQELANETPLDKSRPKSIAIVKQSIERGWGGFFELCSTTNSKPTKSVAAIHDKANMTIDDRKENTSGEYF